MAAGTKTSRSPACGGLRNEHGSAAPHLRRPRDWLPGARPSGLTDSSYTTSIIASIRRNAYLCGHLTSACASAGSFVGAPGGPGENGALPRQHPGAAPGRRSRAGASGRLSHTCRSATCHAHTHAASLELPARDVRGCPRSVTTFRTVAHPSSRARRSARRTVRRRHRVRGGARQFLCASPAWRRRRCPAVERLALPQAGGRTRAMLRGIAFSWPFPRVWHIARRRACRRRPLRETVRRASGCGRWHVRPSPSTRDHDGCERRGLAAAARPGWCTSALAVPNTWLPQWPYPARAPRCMSPHGRGRLGSASGIRIHARPPVLFRSCAGDQGYVTVPEALPQALCSGWCWRRSRPRAPPEVTLMEPWLAMPTVARVSDVW